MTSENLINKTGQEKIFLRLFIAGTGSNSQAAEENLRHFCENFPTGLINIEVIDILRNPQAAQESGVKITPALQLVEAGPCRLFYGSLDDSEALKSFLVQGDSWAGSKVLSYEELRLRLENAERELQAVVSGQVDLVVGDYENMVIRNEFDELRADHVKKVLLAIRNVNQLIVSEDDPFGLIERACSVLSQTLGYFNVLIALLDETLSRAVFMACSEPDSNFSVLCEQLKSGQFPHMIKHTLEKGEVILVENPLTECTDCPMSANYGGRAGLTRRLHHAGRTYGVLSVSVPVAFAHDKEEQELFEELAKDLAFALHRIETVKKFHESQKDLKLAQSMARMGSWRFNLNSGIVIASEEACRIYGLAKSESPIELIQKICLPQFREVLDNSMHRLINEGVPYDVEFQILRSSDNSVRHIHSIAEFDAERKTVVGTIQDITDRKHAEELLQQERERLEFIIDGSELGTWAWNIQTNTTIFNDKWAEMIGYKLEELGSYNFVTWEKLVHPDDLAVASRELARCLSGETSCYQCEFRMRHKNDHWIWILDRGRIMSRDAKGQPLMMFGTHFEITSRKLAEEVIHTRERYLQTILQTTIDGFWVLDSRGVLIEVNDSYCAMSGYSRDELLGKKIADLEAKEEQAETNARIQRIIKNGAELFETRHWRKDGSIWPVEISTTWMFENGGRFICFCRDLSERKQRDERIALLGHMLDSAPAAISIHNTLGQFVFANRLCASMHGYSSEAEFLRLNLHCLDVPDSEAVLEERFRIIAEFGEARFEVYHYRKDGSTFPLEVFAKRIEWEGQPAILSIATDITERKRGEEELIRSKNQLQKIFEILPIGLWFADKNGTLLRGNAMGVKIWGAEPHVPISEYGVFKAWRLPSREKIEADDWSLAKTIRTGVTIVDELLEIESFDGKRKTILNYTAPVLDEKGNISGAIVVNLDLSDRQALEAQLRQSQKMESVGRLAGGVAHDFNNMLGVIIGNTELAMEKVSNEDPVRAFLKQIVSAAERSAGITRQLLAFARKQDIAPTVLNLNEAIAGTLKMIQRLIGEDITLSWLPGENLYPIEIDPSQIDQILANLCVNARDAINGVGTLIVETSSVFFDEAYCAANAGFVPGEFIKLTVSDDGCGMEPQILENVFEPFFTTKELGKGTGLGLATVYGIVKQNQGFIKVYSEVGEGTAFNIYLPAYKEKMAQLPQIRNRRSASVGGTETILLVEDEPTILNLAHIALKELGYVVLPASSPRQAIAMAQKYTGIIHMLMTDVVMPEMNGRALAQIISSSFPDIKLLFMSGYTADVIASRGVLHEGVNFIQKPFSIKDMANKVRQVLDDD